MSSPNFFVKRLEVRKSAKWLVKEALNKENNRNSDIQKNTSTEVVNGSTPSFSNTSSYSSKKNLFCHTFPSGSNLSSTSTSNTQLDPHVTTSIIKTELPSDAIPSCSKKSSIINHIELTSDESNSKLSESTSKLSELGKHIVLASDTIPSSIPANQRKTVWCTQITKFVDAFQNGKPIGDVGIAIIKNFEDDLKFIIYKQKSSCMCAMDLPLIQFVKRNNCLQFFDENNINWILMFSISSDKKEFINKLASYNIPILREKDVYEYNQQHHIFDDTVNNTEKSKKSVLYRIAKMGKSLRNKWSTTTADTSTSDEKETENIQINPTNSSLDTQYLNALAAENRAQNTEMRVNFIKMENKVEKILDKFQILYENTLKERKKDNDIVQLQAKLVSLKKDNKKLKIFIKTKISESNDKLNENLMQEIYEIHKDAFHKIGIPYTRNVKSLIEELIQKAENSKKEIKTTDETISVEETFKLLQNCNAQLSTEKANFHQCESKLMQLEGTMKQLECSTNAVKKLNLELTNKLNIQEKVKTIPNVESVMNDLQKNLINKIQNQELKKDTIAAAIRAGVQEATKKVLENLK